MNRSLSWSAYTLSVMAVFASLATGRLPLNWVINSDTLFYAALLGDFAQTRTLAGWDFPTNPYLFPDLPLYLPFRYVLADVAYSLLAYALAQIAVFTAGIIFLTRQLFPRSDCVEGLVLLMGALYWLLLATGQYHTLAYPLLMLHHFGVAMLMPVCLSLAGWMLSEKTAAERQRWYAIALFALSFMAALSDLLFSLQFVVPAACALLLIWKVRPDLATRTKVLLGTLVFSASLGEIVRRAIVSDSRTVHHTTVSVGHIRNTLIQLQDSLVDIRLSSFLLSVLWLASFVAIVIPLVRSLQRGADDRSVEGVSRLLFDATVVVCLLVSIVAITASGNYYGPATIRYLLPAFVLPLFLGLPYFWGRTRAGPMLCSRRVAPVLSGVVGLLALFSLLFPTASSAAAGRPSFTDPVVTCLDENAQVRGLQRGVAQYWVAPYVTELSKTGLVVVQVDPNLLPVHLNSNIRWYEADFDFAIVDPMPDWGIAENQVSERFGPPAGTFTCGPYMVLVYNRPEDVVFRNYFASRHELADFQTRHDAYEFRGFGLPSSTGRIVGFSRGADQAHKDSDGALTYGPYVELPPGNYRYAIHYFSDGPNVGEWQVTVRNRENVERILDGGEFTNPGTGVISGTMTLAESQTWEALAYYYGHGALYVDKIVLEKDRAGAPSSGAGDGPRPSTSTESLDAYSITLVHPEHDATLHTQYVDFVWQWSGMPLDEGRSFEVRIWHADDPFHYGAHDAQLASQMIRQVGDMYTLRLNLRGVHSVQQHGPGKYQWSVGVVAVDPIYQDLGVEASPHSITIGPMALGDR